MSPIWKNKQFHEDLFAGELPASCRNELVAQMSRARRQRKTEQRIAVVSCLLIVASSLFLIPKQKHRSEMARNAPVPAWEIVSQPFEGIVRSELPPSLLLETPKNADLLVIHTEQFGTYTEISDDQLLALFQGRPVALVKDHGRAELEFLDEQSDGN
jgi:hypothetical protein